MGRRGLMLAGLALVVAGCGSGGDSGSSRGGGGGFWGGPGGPAGTRRGGPSPPGATGGQTLRLSADPGGALKFTTSTLRAKAGKVTIRMTNPSPTAHSIAIEGNGV